MQKLKLLLLELYRKYNDLVVYHVISLPFYGIMIILYYWFTGDLSATGLLILFICALYLPPVYFVNKKRTCPDCKKWIYNTSNHSNNCSKYICKKCNAEWS